MNGLKLLQSFAVSEAGHIVSVEQVERGLACGCMCPSCGNAVVARQGDVRAWHFAHATSEDCPHGAESALHLAAKQVIERTKGIQLPALRVRREVFLDDGRRGEHTSEQPSVWVDFNDVRLEQPVGTRRPDVVGYQSQTLYLIEIAVSHFVGEDKASNLAALGMPAIEIDLAKHSRESWTWETLEEAVIFGVTAKSWLFAPEAAKLEADAEKLARDKALLQPIPASELQGPTEVRKRVRFRVRDHYLELRELPFGTTLWAPYDKAFNETIKQWAYQFGGRYKPRYRNWLFPNIAFPLLVSSIEAEGGLKL